MAKISIYWSSNYNMKPLHCCQGCDCNVLIQNFSYLPVPKIPHCFISYCSQTGSKIQMLCGNLILVLHYILQNYLHRICVLQKTSYHTSNSGGRLVMVLVLFICQFLKSSQTCYFYWWHKIKNYQVKLKTFLKIPNKSDLLVGRCLKVVGLESPIFFWTIYAEFL